MTGWSRTIGILAVAGLVSGCAGRAWRAAGAANTGSAYRAFVTANPEHRKVPEALRRAEQIDWDDARAQDTPVAYLAYVGAYPTGEHSVDAYAMAETRSWEAAQAEHSPESYTAFLARFPNSNQRIEAETLMEVAYYEHATTEGTEEAWGRYLVRYPNGQFVAAAMAERERLAWESTVAANTRSAYANFASRYSQSERRREAMRWIRDSRVTTLQPVVVLSEAKTVDAAGRAPLARAVRRVFDASLLDELGQEFAIRRTIMVDLQGGPAPHPQDAYGVEPDVGLLVLTYEDEPGRRFEPAGRATDLEVDLALYAPPTRIPTWSTSFEASTPDEAYGNTVLALRDGALSEMGAFLAGFADELAEERRGR